MIARRKFFAIVGAALGAVVIPFKRTKPAPAAPQPPVKTWIERFVERAREGAPPAPPNAPLPPEGTTGALSARYAHLERLKSEHKEIWLGVKNALIELDKVKTTKGVV